jgi:chromosome segregation ATPase
VTSDGIGKIPDAVNHGLTNAAQPCGSPGHRPIAGRSSAPGTTLMPVETLTYADLADRLKISPEAARAIAKRHRLPRSRANDGKTLVKIDLSEIQHRALPARSPGGHQAVITSLKAKIEALQAEIARLEAAAAGHRADFERERDRADRLMTELLKATGDMVTAKEATAWLEGELAALRSRPETWPAEIARVEAIASGCRADYERDRADRLAAEVQKATADTMTAKEAMARLEREVGAMRSRPWWRRIAGGDPFRKRQAAKAA